jgi:hypothetical protein
LYERLYHKVLPSGGQVGAVPAQFREQRQQQEMHAMLRAPPPPLPGLECNVCYAATSPPDAGISCGQGHYTCRTCFCTLAITSCAPGGGADIPRPGKPRGVFKCLIMECSELLSDQEAVAQIHHDVVAYRAFQGMKVAPRRRRVTRKEPLKLVHSSLPQGNIVRPVI